MESDNIRHAYTLWFAPSLFETYPDDEPVPDNHLDASELDPVPVKQVRRHVVTVKRPSNDRLGYLYVMAELARQDTQPPEAQGDEHPQDDPRRRRRARSGKRRTKSTPAASR